MSPLSPFTVIAQKQRRQIEMSLFLSFFNVLFVEGVSDWQLTEWNYWRGSESVVIKV